jgi:hypothetical protein
MLVRTFEVRRRLLPALAGVAVFLVLGRLSDPAFFHTVPFAVGLGTAVSATFLEPFFARPQDALMNGAGALIAYLAIDRGPNHSLWTAFLIFDIALLASGLLATTMRDDNAPPKWDGRSFASTFGRAVIVGPAFLAVVMLNEAAAGATHVARLVVAVATLSASLAAPWRRIMGRLARGEADSATAVAAIGPRMLLAAAGGGFLRIGCPVSVVGTGAVSGTIVSRLAHQQGVRYQIALEDDWSKVCASFPAEITVTASGTPSRIVGSVGDGTSEVLISFGPLQRLSVGEPVMLGNDAEPLLYQTTELRLIAETWSGATSLVPHAIARQIGRPRDGLLTSVSYLPDPHEPVRTTESLAAAVPVGFFRIGRVKGTEIEIGIVRDQQLRGHMAILGMSGMGKTAVAQRIAHELGTTELFIALDLTGEYRGRLHFPAWIANNFAAVGHFVHEPTGDPPLRARELVTAAMVQGSTEYAAGGSPLPRNVLLEEAHSFIPEWNFATPGQSADVNLTTRAIMQARKYGIRFLIVSQRTAVVSKSALSQCDNYIVFRTVDHTGLEYVESLAGSAFRETLAHLNKYEALCMGPAFNADQPVIVELDAPDLVAVAAPEAVAGNAENGAGG